MNIDGAITVCVAANPYLDSAEALLGELLEKTAHPLESCDAFAFGAGPGRFSGLRLACGMIQGFAYAFKTSRLLQRRPWRLWRRLTMVPKKTKRLRHCRRIVSIFTLPCVGGKQVFGKARARTFCRLTLFYPAPPSGKCAARRFCVIRRYYKGGH